MALRAFQCPECEAEFVTDSEAAEATDSLTCPICGEAVDVEEEEEEDEDDD